MFGDFEHDLIRCLESTFELGRRFWSTMRIDCGQLDPGAVIRPVPSEWDPRMPECLDEEELADWRISSPHRRCAQSFQDSDIPGLGGHLQHLLGMNSECPFAIACIRLTRPDKLTVPSR